MAQYDTETLYLHALQMQAALLQVACDAITELTSLTRQEDLLDSFFEQVANVNADDLVISSRKPTPLRKQLARQLTRSLLRNEVVPALRLAAKRGAQIGARPKH